MIKTTQSPAEANEWMEEAKFIGKKIIDGRAEYTFEFKEKENEPQVKEERQEEEVEKVEKVEKVEEVKEEVIKEEVIKEEVVKEEVVKEETKPKPKKRGRPKR